MLITNSGQRIVSDLAARLDPLLSRLAMVYGLATLALILLCSPAQASNQVHLVVSDSARYYQQVADTIIDNIRRRHPGKGVSQHKVNELTAIDPSEDDLLICIGTKASIAALRDYPDQPQLNLVITETAWQNLSHQLPQSHKANIYIDQPVERLVALARVIAPDAKKYSTVLGPIAARHQAELAAAIRRAGVGLHTEIISAESNPLAILTPLLADTDVFIAIPDNAVINRTIAKWALFLAFKHKIPVIGFSQAYHNAGAAASLYTSSEDISRQAMEWLDNYFLTPEFNDWRHRAPKYFTISVNTSVVRTLGLGSKDPAELHESVLHQLQRTSP